MRYADVILPLPLEGLFTYSVSPSLEGVVRFGMRVVVPFGRSKTYIGVVVRVHDKTPEGYEVKPVTRVPDAEECITDGQYRLWQWIADYYMSPIGEVMKAALPSGLKDEDGWRPRTELYVRLTPPYRTERALHIAMDMLRRADRQMAVLTSYLALSHWDTLRGDNPLTTPVEITREELMNVSHANLASVTALVKRGVLETYTREVGRLNAGGAPCPDNIRQLSQPQQDAYNSILFSFLSKNVTLLHGVTSSGKTEIYIHLIQRELDAGRQVLYLLPEIALTVQMMDRLRRVFGRRLGIYHSKYSDAERVEIWRKQLSDAPFDIILGARSAVLLPFRRLGLVIVDEEHDQSYKQFDPAPRYNGRDVAIMLASMHGAKTLLGSATPAIDTYYKAQQGKFGLVSLSERYGAVTLPEIRIIDMKQAYRAKTVTGAFAAETHRLAIETISRGAQVIMFQNRRGYAPITRCKQCAWVPRCEQCDVALTYHSHLRQLQCHYCGAVYPLPTVCPQCHEPSIETIGYGTERIEEEVEQQFHGHKMLRMDLDTTRNKNAYSRIIDDFSDRKASILVGTQMVTKGLDFGGVEMVAVLNADSIINYPDFRSCERAFCMLEQVAGRAGRREGNPGIVVVQTYNPAHPVLGYVARHDYDAFFKSELEERRRFTYPPFSRIIYLYIKHRDSASLRYVADALAQRLRQLLGNRVYGPEEPAVSRVQGLYIRKIMLKVETNASMAKVKELLRQTYIEMHSLPQMKGAILYYDVDPI